jgi:hypothetical protein
MNFAPFNRTGLRWVPTAGPGMAPLAIPAIFHGVPWSIAFTISAAATLLSIIRGLVPEVLSHIRLMKQLQHEETRDLLHEFHEHDEAKLRESNQHEEIVLLFHKVDGNARFDIDMARVVERIRTSVPVQQSPTPAVIDVSASEPPRDIDAVDKGTEAQLPNEPNSSSSTGVDS